MVTVIVLLELIAATDRQMSNHKMDAVEVLQSVSSSIHSVCTHVVKVHIQKNSSICKCMCVCVYVYMYVCMYVRTYVHVCM